MRQKVRFGVISLAALLATAAGAQSFPSKPVRIIVAFPAGGGTDITARVIGPKLTEIWGHQVLVDNRPGASGTIGTEQAARAAPDGHTLFMGTMGNLSVNKHLFPKLALDPARDMVPVTQVVAVQFVMVAHPSLPANNVKELIALARKQPGQITYGTSGAGGAPHLGGELLKKMAKIDLMHIPYKGSAISMQELVGGQIMLSFDSLLQFLPFIRSQKVRPLAVLGSSRSATLPGVPTADESGVPGYELTNWFGLVLPAATPQDVSRKIAADVSKVLSMPEIREKFSTMGAMVVGSPPEEFGAFMRSESDKWAKLIAEAGIKAQ